MEDGLPSGDWEVFADGFSGMEKVMNPGDAVHRPTGLALGPDGSLYISDSRKGTIWRVIFTGEEMAEAAPASVMESENVVLADHPGEKLYKFACMACHQADGNGVPGMHPPLKGSEWVTGDKERLIRIVLEGVKGEIKVNGEIYNSVMPPVPQLDATQVADLLSFIRISFGNDASEITVEEVEKVMNRVRPTAEPN
jgi:mono/diheme cytochrome c family protein